jgi:hemoglobin
VTTTVYAVVGGQAFFDALVDRFYGRVEVDPVLRPLYPGDDLGPARRHLALFLGQYWGGPTTYSDERGHPRLRMRHAPFAIGKRERDAWFRAMRQSVLEAHLDPEVEFRLLDYFSMTADHLVNRPS